MHFDALKLTVGDVILRYITYRIAYKLR